jgi:hypothetical protein
MYALFTPLQRRSGANSAVQGFYDPVGERLIEPKHTGISYSFTSDGFFESAHYRAIANRTSKLSKHVLAQQKGPQC